MTAQMRPVDPAVIRHIQRVAFTVDARPARPGESDVIFPRDFAEQYGTAVIAAAMAPTGLTWEVMAAVIEP